MTNAQLFGLCPAADRLKWFFHSDDTTDKSRSNGGPEEPQWGAPGYWLIPLFFAGLLFWIALLT